MSSANRQQFTTPLKNSNVYSRTALSSQKYTEYITPESNSKKEASAKQHGDVFQASLALASSTSSAGSQADSFIGKQVLTGMYSRPRPTPSLPPIRTGLLASNAEAVAMRAFTSAGRSVLQHGNGSEGVRSESSGRTPSPSGSRRVSPSSPSTTSSVPLTRDLLHLMHLQSTVPIYPIPGMHRDVRLSGGAGAEEDVTAFDGRGGGLTGGVRRGTTPTPTSLSPGLAALAGVSLNPRRPDLPDSDPLQAIMRDSPGDAIARMDRAVEAILFESTHRTAPPPLPLPGLVSMVPEVTTDTISALQSPRQSLPSPVGVPRLDLSATSSVSPHSLLHSHSATDADASRSPRGVGALGSSRDVSPSIHSTAVMAARLARREGGLRVDADGSLADSELHKILLSAIRAGAEVVQADMHKHKVRRRDHARLPDIPHQEGWSPRPRVVSTISSIVSPPSSLTSSSGSGTSAGQTPRAITVQNDVVRLVSPVREASPVHVIARSKPPPPQAENEVVQPRLVFRGKAVMVAVLVLAALALAIGTGLGVGSAGLGAWWISFLSSVGPRVEIEPVSENVYVPAAIPSVVTLAKAEGGAATVKPTVTLMAVTLTAVPTKETSKEKTKATFASPPTPTATLLLATVTTIPTKVAVAVTPVPTKVSVVVTPVPTKVAVVVTPVPTKVPVVLTPIPTKVVVAATPMPTKMAIVTPVPTQAPAQIPTTAKASGHAKQERGIPSTPEQTIATATTEDFTGPTAPSTLHVRSSAIVVLLLSTFFVVVRRYIHSQRAKRRSLVEHGLLDSTVAVRYPSADQGDAGAGESMKRLKRRGSISAASRVNVDDGTAVPAKNKGRRSGAISGATAEQKSAVLAIPDLLWSTLTSPVPVLWAFVLRALPIVSAVAMRAMQKMQNMTFQEKTSSRRVGAMNLGHEHARFDTDAVGLIISNKGIGAEPTLPRSDLSALGRGTGRGRSKGRSVPPPPREHVHSSLDAHVEEKGEAERLAHRVMQTPRGGKGRALEGSFPALVFTTMGTPTAGLRVRGRSSTKKSST